MPTLTLYALKYLVTTMTNDCKPTAAEQQILDAIRAHLAILEPVISDDQDLVLVPRMALAAVLTNTSIKPIDENKSEERQEALEGAILSLWRSL